MKAIYFALALLLLAVPARSQEQASEEERIARIARSVLDGIFDIRAEKPASEARRALAARIARDIAGDLGLPQDRVDARIQQMKDRESERRTLIVSALRSFLKGLGIVAVILLLRWIVGVIDRKRKGETPRDRRLASLVKIDVNALAVFVRIPSEEEAETLGRSLVEARLAASAGVTAPLRALHPEQTEDRQEVLLILKTRRHRMAKLKRKIGDLHSPNADIIACPIRQGYKPYIEQIRKATRRILW